MLYDPKWEKIYTTANLADWLGTQPFWKPFDYTKPDECAVAQYLRAHGIVECSMSVDRLKELGWDDIVNIVGAPSTFGIAARRARRAAHGPWWVRASKAIYTAIFRSHRGF